MRILDANMNRAKEGLRVCEDISRFILDDPRATRSYKNIRHRLTDILSTSKAKDWIKSRSVEEDVGRGSLPLELKRKDVHSIFYANSQRVKESLRVLEEFTKLTDIQVSGEIKKARYSVYVLEQKITERL